MTTNKQLRELAEKATPGTWWIDSHGHRMSANGGSETVFIASEKMGEAKRHPETGNLSHWPNDWDASYIAAANPERALALLDEIEALQTECEKLRKDAERYQSQLEAVLREIPHREGRRGNAPGHCHSVPGVWDEDNGALAGKECAWCKVWNEAVSAMQEPPK